MKNKSYQNGQVVRWAEFSDDMVYRYRLIIDWAELLFRQPDAERSRILFLMCNPSTADEMKNDPTVERCERRARNGMFSSVEVCNLFALRSTNPKALYSHADPEGPENLKCIRQAVKEAQMVVCAWGVHGALGDAEKRMLQMLGEMGVKAFTLGLTKDGHPRHPLYVSYEKGFELLREEA